MDTINRFRGILTEATEGSAFVKKWLGKSLRMKYEGEAMQLLADGFGDGEVKAGDIRNSVEGPGPANLGADGAERTVTSTYRFESKGLRVEAVFEWFGAGNTEDQDDADQIGFDITLSTGGKVLDRDGAQVQFKTGKEPGAKFISAFSKVYNKMAKDYLKTSLSKKV
jgi:hypothetical protein